MRKEYLCIVIDKNTGEELAEYRPDAFDDWYARHIAADMFKKDQKHQPNLRKHEDWYVDACEI